MYIRVLALMKNINDNALALIFKVPRKKIHSSWKSESILSSKIQDFLCQIVTAKEDKTIIAGRKKNQKHVLWSKDTSIFLNGLIIFFNGARPPSHIYYLLMSLYVWSSASTRSYS